MKLLRLMTTGEAARKLGHSTTFIRSLCDSDKLRHHKTASGRYLIEPAAIREYQAKDEQPTPVGDEEPATFEQAAEFLGLAVISIDSYAKNGRLQYYDRKNRQVTWSSVRAYKEKRNPRLSAAAKNRTVFRGRNSEPLDTTVGGYDASLLQTHIGHLMEQYGPGVAKVTVLSACREAGLVL